MGQVDTSARDDPVRELEANLWETWSIFGRGTGCALYEKDGLLWFETPIPIVPYNGVLKSQLQADVDQRIDEVVQHFRQKQAQFMWIVHPSSSPPDLRARLSSRGLVDVEPILGMARGLDHLPAPPPLPDGIEIRQVADERDASAFYQFAAWRWHIPDKQKELYAAIAKAFRIGQSGAKARMWQAWRDGQPVAKAGLYLGAESAGIYGVVTRPKARRLGLARTLSLTALQEAHSQGYRLAILHSSPMAERLYRSLGFEPVAEFRLFASEEVHV